MQSSQKRSLTAETQRIAEVSQRFFLSLRYLSVLCVSAVEEPLSGEIVMLFLDKP